jgi:N,N'-diacetyllegionaminate synthase
MAYIKNLAKFGFNTHRRTYVIAEIGINHDGNYDNALRLIDSAARTGCDAVKFQTYRTESRAPDGNQDVFDTLKRLELPLEAFGKLKNHCAETGMDFFSTPFDLVSLEYLQSIDVDLYKIASFDVVNHSLLRSVAATRKPIMLSVGMADRDEIDAAYTILRKSSPNIALLHCISSYPLQPVNANLTAINVLREAYDCVIGYSDHTSGIEVPLMAVSAGAQIIEKHYKIDEQMDCIDAPVSITETQMAELVSRIREVETIFGDGALGVREVEKPITVFRRSTD